MQRLRRYPFVYAADVHANEHERCRALLETWRRGRGAWFLTWGICYQFLRVVTHPRVLRNPWVSRAAAEFLDALTAAPSLSMLVPGDRHRELLSDLVASIPSLNGNLWHDAETAVLMREHGIRRICTRDTDFHRFPFLEVVDPLAAAP